MDVIDVVEVTYVPGCLWILATSALRQTGFITKVINLLLCDGNLAVLDEERIQLFTQCADLSSASYLGSKFVKLHTDVCDTTGK